MPGRISKLFIAISFLILLSGCAATYAPYGWLSNPDQLQTEAYGGWIVVTYSTKNSGNNKKMGELIAVSYDSVFVLADSTLTVIPTFAISHARITEYDSHVGELGLWVFFGMASTISHGWYLVLTAPILWLLAGTIAASSRSHDPILDYPKASLKSFKSFARFPQGLPQNLNRRALKPKPVH